MMTLARILTGWSNRVARSWDKVHAGVIEATRLVREDTAHSGYWYLQGAGLDAAVMVAPEKVATVSQALASIADAAIAEHAAEVGSGVPRDDAVPMMSFANLVECTGGTLARATPATMREWLPRLRLDRDKWPRVFWTAAFAALALGDRATYRRFTGVDHKRDLAFEAHATFEANLQGLAAHLAGAIEHGGSRDDVMPAYDELVLQYPGHSQARVADGDTLLWIGRVVEHRIGGAPVATVAQRVHDKLVELA